jgi:hypothetical protein
MQNENGKNIARDHPAKDQGNAANNEDSSRTEWREMLSRLRHGGCNSFGRVIANSHGALCDLRLIHLRNTRGSYAQA